MGRYGETPLELQAKQQYFKDLNLARICSVVTPLTSAV